MALHWAMYHTGYTISTMSERSNARGGLFSLDYIATVLPWLVSTVALLALAMHIASSILPGPALWDDASMTVRYAHNILAHGASAWNGNTPSYGITSQFLLLITLP